MSGAEAENPALAFLEEYNASLAGLLDALQADEETSATLSEATRSCLETFSRYREAAEESAPPIEPGEMASRLHRALRLQAIATSMIENEHAGLAGRLDRSRSLRGFLRASASEAPVAGESCNVAG